MERQDTREALARLIDARRREVDARRLLEPGFRLRERLGTIRPAGRLERALRRPAGAPVRLVAPAASDGAARALGRAGAAALEVATAPRVAGAFAGIDGTRAAVGLPLLLADLVVDEHQLLEAAVHGLDGVTLGAAACSEVELQVLVGQARLLGLDPLVRVAGEDELRRALRAGATLVGLARGPLPATDAGVLAALEQAAAVPPLVTAVALAGAELEPGDLHRLAATRCDAALADVPPGADPESVLAARLAAAGG
jgi:indole-3-glycerol phosphate synthase